MKSARAVFVVFVLCCVCLTGCSGKNRFERKIDKSLEEIKAYAATCNEDDFRNVSVLLMRSGVEWVQFENGELQHADLYTNELRIELNAFHQKYPDIWEITVRGEHELEFWLEYGSCIIVCENGEPTASLSDLDDFVRKEFGDTIYWISDHRKDHDSYHSRMYYEFGFQRIDDTLWAGKFYAKYPWYSYFIV